MDQTPKYCLSPACSALFQARSMLQEITEQNDRLEAVNRDLNASRNDWKALAESKSDRVAELESERNDLMHREHEATVQMSDCHKVLDRLGAPRSQDNGLNYYLNGRLSRLVAGETGKLWAAEMGAMTALLRRACSVIPSEYEDEIEVRAAINQYLNAHQG